MTHVPVKRDNSAAVKRPAAGDDHLGPALVKCSRTCGTAASSTPPRLATWNIEDDASLSCGLGSHSSGSKRGSCQESAERIKSGDGLIVVARDFAEGDATVLHAGEWKSVAPTAVREPWVGQKTVRRSLQNPRRARVNESTSGLRKAEEGKVRSGYDGMHSEDMSHKQPPPTPHTSRGRAEHVRHPRSHAEEGDHIGMFIHHHHHQAQGRGGLVVSTASARPLVPPTDVPLSQDSAAKLCLCASHSVSGPLYMIDF